MERLPVERRPKFRQARGQLGARAPRPCPKLPARKTAIEISAKHKARPNNESARGFFAREMSRPTPRRRRLSIAKDDSPVARSMQLESWPHSPFFLESLRNAFSAS